jgi:hypothetical protein
MSRRTDDSSPARIDVQRIANAITKQGPASVPMVPGTAWQGRPVRPQPANRPGQSSRVPARALGPGGGAGDPRSYRRQRSEAERAAHRGEAGRESLGPVASLERVSPRPRPRPVPGRARPRARGPAGRRRARPGRPGSFAAGQLPDHIHHPTVTPSARHDAAAWPIDGRPVPGRNGVTVISSAPFGSTRASPPGISVGPIL